MKQVLKLTITDFISVNHYLAYRAIMKNGRPMATSYKTTEAKKYYRVVAGSFTSYGAAKIKMAEVQDVGYSAFVKQTNVNGVTYYRVYAGSYTLKQNAVNQQTVLKAKGISSFLVYE